MPWKHSKLLNQDQIMFLAFLLGVKHNKHWNNDSSCSRIKNYHLPRELLEPPNYERRNIQERLVYQLNFFFFFFLVPSSWCYYFAPSRFVETAYVLRTPQRYLFSINTQVCNHGHVIHCQQKHQTSRPYTLSTQGHYNRWTVLRWPTLSIR